MNLPLDACAQVERSQSSETLDMLEHVPGVGFDGRLAQPRQPGRFAAFLALEKIVQTSAVETRERICQSRIDASVGARDRLGADALDDIQRRQQHTLSAQTL